MGYGQELLHGPAPRRGRASRGIRPQALPAARGPDRVQRLALRRHQPVGQPGRRDLPAARVAGNGRRKPAAAARRTSPGLGGTTGSRGPGGTGTDRDSAAEGRAAGGDGQPRDSRQGPALGHQGVARACETARQGLAATGHLRRGPAGTDPGRSGPGNDARGRRPAQPVQSATQLDSGRDLRDRAARGGHRRMDPGRLEQVARGRRGERHRGSPGHRRRLAGAGEGGAHAAADHRHRPEQEG